MARRRLPEDAGVVDGARARAVAELQALADRLPVTDGYGGPPESGPPIDVQIAVRDEARDHLDRGAVAPEEDADRLWARLPSYWRR